MNNFFTNMQARGFIKDSNFSEFPQGPLTAYIGFDLTAPALHVGSLIQLMALRWLKAAGHRPIVLLGEATTRIGDPSGKDESRRMLTDLEIENNRRGIRRSIEQIVPGIEFVSNAEWFGDEPSFMGFLVEYGPHFTINRMMTFDSVKMRLQRQQPLTLLEFSYMLLQAVDLRELRIRHGVNMQIGGSDQWGNILNGVEIIRRKDQADVHAMTTPLLLDRDGNKMGKSQGRPVWLSPDMTSPMEFFQYWRNCDDIDVLRFFRLFTEVPVDDIKYLIADQTIANGGAIDINALKKRLAHAITEIVHGKVIADNVLAQAEAVYERGDLSVLPVGLIIREATTVVDIMVRCELAESKSAARRLIAGNGVRINGERISADYLVESEIVIQVGKKNPVRVRRV